MLNPTTTKNVVQDMMRDRLPANLRCLNCMQNKGSAQRCPQCGYAEHQHKNHPLYLKPRTLLKNQYLIGKSLGQGGFGITYIAFDCWLHKRVAIKEFLPSALATRDFLTATVVPVKKQEAAFMQGLQLFIEEARNLARFDHPNIVRVINFFETNNTGYMVMEYLDGENLADFLARQPSGHFALETALDIMMPILTALTVVHAQHIYHRDISLQNIRLLSDGTPILIDFGAARHVVGENSQTLDMVLKHGYSPLEQYSGRGRIGPWTDIYACGALLYLLLSGHLPPAATDRLAGEHLLPLPAMLGVGIIPESIEQAILRALALKPQQRFTHVTQFQAALQGEPLPALPEPVLSPVRPWLRPVLLTFLFLALFAAGLTTLHDKTQQPSAITHLLTQAQQQWTQDRLTSPAQDNAWQTYLQILREDPKQPEALAGLQQLVDYYWQQAKRAQQQKAWNSALTALEKGLQVRPNDSALLTLKTAVLAAKAHAETVATHLAQAEQALAESQLATAATHYQAVLTQVPEQATATEGLRQIATQYETLARAQQDDISNSLALIQEGLQVFPNHVGLLTLQAQLQANAAEQSRNEARRQAITQLLQQAEQHLAALRLTEPAGNNAYEVYQQVLQQVPAHPQALTGFKRIADQYVQLARAETNDRARRRNFLEKGLMVMPTHSTLLALKQQFNTEATPPPKLATPVEPVTAPPPATKTPAQQWAQQGDQAFAAQAYALAAQHYQKSLQLQPAQPTVQAQLARIISYYQQRAVQAKNQAAWENSLTWINQGLALEPQHAALLALQKEVQAKITAQSSAESSTEAEVEAEAETIPKNVIFTPSF